MIVNIKNAPVSVRVTVLGFLSIVALVVIPVAEDWSVVAIVGQIARFVAAWTLGRYVGIAALALGKQERE